MTYSFSMSRSDLLIILLCKIQVRKNHSFKLTLIWNGKLFCLPNNFSPADVKQDKMLLFANIRIWETKKGDLMVSRLC